MAQFEIEIKLPLKNLKETLKFLTDQGFQETAQIQEEDTYFNSVYHDVKNVMKHCVSEQAQTADPVFLRLRLILRGPNWIKSPCPEWNWKQKYPMQKCLKYSHPSGFFSGSVCHENAKVYEMWQIYRLSGSGRGAWRLSGA